MSAFGAVVVFYEAAAAPVAAELSRPIPSRTAFRPNVTEPMVYPQAANATLFAPGALALHTPAVLALHAPDGLFSLRVNLAFAAVVVLALLGAARLLARHGDHRLAPAMGIMAAFIFAAQMANFPIAAGVSGHLVGGTLAAILLGPWAAALVLAAVIFFQALLGDGGISVLGPNIFNMGLLGTFGGYLIFRAVNGLSDRPARIVAAAAFAAWSAVVLASVAVSLQLAISGTASLQRVLPPLVWVHMAIGVGEALITAAAVAFVLKTRPELLYGVSGPGVRLATSASRLGLGLALCACVAIGVAAGPLPAFWSAPDGLEYVGQKHGFVDGGAPAGGAAAAENAGVPRWWGLLGTSIAGGVGTLVMFAGSLAVGRVLTRRSRLERALDEPGAAGPAQP